MMSRTDRAHALARRIEAIERCPILTNETLQTIERALADYAIEHLADLRGAIIARTMSAPMKTRLVALIDAAIQAEANQ